ncbi:PREDICTED: deoxyribose-phosphate aldolase [Papilio polytes]|uniref:deoxyribose-phosphate aldolase n=1 Tax=Papilio polytes TaxID=76194 RepID=UPI0006767804|nr:PREDICTED: deoxyribose-phosphate aldolase [Papilio polytes]
MVRDCNKTLPLNTIPEEFVNNVYISKNSLENQIRCILNDYPIVENDTIKPWLLQVISVIDLTTLSGDDTRSNVIRLCQKAANPLKCDLLNKLGIDNNKLRTAAVCVYPTRVPDAHDIIKQMGLTDTIQIASVATGFPSGLYPLVSRLQEISIAISKGATEIDVVLDRSLVLTGKWDDVYNEVVQMRKACGDAHLKVILGVGELGTYENVYKASMISMLAGADFIKTSTGKEAVNATLPVGLVMCRAIRNFYQLTGVKVGLKPAGGIKTARDAINWLVLVYTELGPEWITPDLFRIGASSLLDVVEKCLCNCTKVTPKSE